MMDEDSSSSSSVMSSPLRSLMVLLQRFFASSSSSTNLVACKNAVHHILSLHRCQICLECGFQRCNLSGYEYRHHLHGKRFLVLLQQVLASSSSSTNLVAFTDALYHHSTLPNLFPYPWHLSPYRQDVRFLPKPQTLLQGRQQLNFVNQNSLSTLDREPCDSAELWTRTATHVHSWQMGLLPEKQVLCMCNTSTSAARA